jgi:hypothetical protein
VITCINVRRQAGFFCDYRKRISDLVYLKARFVDFRFHGGRKFANDRMRLVLETYCAYDATCGLKDDALFDGRKPTTRSSAHRRNLD